MTVKIIKSSEFGMDGCFSYGFFTRAGGVSSGIYDSLNCGIGSNDIVGNVKKNRHIAAKSLSSELEENNLITLHQIHSDKVVIVGENFVKKQEADALVTNKAWVILGILTADCTPVLFADNNAKIIGAAHAGWKGAFSGILENTIEKMLELGANKENIRAVIGPTISRSSYEVGYEFYDKFIVSDKKNAIFFTSSKKEKHYMFDLPQYVESKLKNAGVNSVFNVNIDTYDQANNLFSYRRSCHNNEEGYGRNLSVILLNN